ncbi:uncharacterized protein LOC144911041 [Branchiostoma floridae x Branchiostoma belcheri]
MWTFVLLVAAVIASPVSSHEQQDYLTSVDGWKFYKMRGGNVRITCEAAGLRYPCHQWYPETPNQSDSDSCIQVVGDSESVACSGDKCWTHQVLSEKLCGQTDASRCHALDDTFVYIPDWLTDSSAYGVDYETNSVILLGSDNSNTTDRFAICADIAECRSNSCQNGGTCVDTANSFNCICDRGYTGVFCETDIDYCADPNVCMNHSFPCVDQLYGYYCEVPMGARTSPEYCTESPCGIDWYCKEDSVTGYSCISD